MPPPAAPGQYSESVGNSEQRRARWWQAIKYRRCYVSDRTWFGVGLAVAFGAATAASLFFVIPVAVGVAMVMTGLARAYRRTDPATGERSPGPPW